MQKVRFDALRDVHIALVEEFPQKKVAEGENVVSRIHCVMEGENMNLLFFSRLARSVVQDDRYLESDWLDLFL
jgi:hypothetical protein